VADDIRSRLQGSHYQELRFMRGISASMLIAGVLAAGTASSADFGIYGTAGTIGLGGGVAADFNPHLGARFGYTTYTYDIDDREESDLVLNGEADLGGSQALLDWYPMGGHFRLTVGAVETADIHAKATPVADTFTFDGVEYSSDDVGDARAHADFGSLAPYVGLGFGRALSANGHLSFTADVGVAFSGAPDVTLDVTCNAPNAMLCAELASDAAAEEEELQNDADDYKYWPVVSLGVSYKF
jgi:hypothetical protein